MDINGKGITQSDLESLPEVSNAPAAILFLWQPKFCVIDANGTKWAIGFHGERLCKRKRLD